MSPITTRRLRSAALCTLACAALMATLSAGALASTPQERYYRSFDASPAQTQAAYYSSYGEPEPIAPAPAPAAGDPTPWPAVVVSLALVALIAGASTVQVRRLRLRRRRAVGAAL